MGCTLCGGACSDAGCGVAAGCEAGIARGEAGDAASLPRVNMTAAYAPMAMVTHPTTARTIKPNTLRCASTDQSTSGKAGLQARLLQRALAKVAEALPW